MCGGYRGSRDWAFVFCQRFTGEEDDFARGRRCLGLVRRVSPRFTRARFIRTAECVLCGREVTPRATLPPPSAAAPAPARSAVAPVAALRAVTAFQGARDRRLGRARCWLG